MTTHTTTHISARAPTGVPGRYLLIDDEPGERLVALTGEVTHVGRGPAAQIRLEDQAVSRRHALLLQRGATTWIVDEHATNGTFVNDRRVPAAPLADGDVIVVGRTHLTYLEPV